MLSKVMTDLDEKAGAKIKTAHENTQTEINVRIDEVSSATRDVLNLKKIADSTDRAWFYCVGEEKALRVAVEESEEALVHATQAVDEPCQEQEDRKMFTMELTCDVS